MKVLFSLISLVLLLSLQGQNNNYTYIEYDSLSSGYVQLTLDKRMDDLLESKKYRCDELRVWRQSQSSNSSKEETNITFKDLCKNHPKMKGFRIQVLNTRSSEDAEKAKEKLQVQFPQLSSNVELRRPQFRVLMGDYFSKANAASDLNEVKKIYPGALLVVTKIWCNRAQ